MLNLLFGKRFLDLSKVIFLGVALIEVRGGPDDRQTAHLF